MSEKRYETVEFIHKQWEDYIKKHDVSKDVEALIKLVEDNTGIARNESEVLATVYDSALVVLDSSPLLDEEEKTRASYFSYALCTSETCKKDCAAYMNKKGQVRMSHQFFLDILNQKGSPAFGVLELMYTILHEFMHGIFPELTEDEIVEKTEQTWISGMSELLKQ
jgi:hypothetical protein